MAAVKALKPGTSVRLITHIIQGVVVKPEVNGEDFGYIVKYIEGDGESHERFFPADRLEEISK